MYQIMVGTNFQNLLQANGIFWQSGPRNTPQYNAVVERNVQTKKAMVRALHLQSQLSGGYWPLTNAGMITPYQAHVGSRCHIHLCCSAQLNKVCLLDTMSSDRHIWFYRMGMLKLSWLEALYLTNV